MTRTLLILLCALAASFNVSAHGPSRIKVTETVTVAASAAEVWQLVADFCAIEQWHPGVVACAGEGGNEPGATRVLTAGSTDGPQIHEELLKYDAEKMSYKYKITKTDNKVLPVITYSAFLTVKPIDDENSEVEWRGGFYRAYPNNNPPEELNDEAARSAVTATYRAGLAEIKKLAEQ